MIDNNFVNKNLSRSYINADDVMMNGNNKRVM